MIAVSLIVLNLVSTASLGAVEPSPQDYPEMGFNLPEEAIRIAYEKAATQNVLAAVNPKVFPGYWCVCADGVGFGYGNTYPSLDGHQLTDALLWLGQVDVVKANWDYVKTFQRPNGQLPIAILPGEAGKNIGPPESSSPVDANGGLYRHWVPGDPLRALASPTFIQNADVLFRWTQDRAWLEANLASVNLAADFLASLTTPEGAVGGAGYYVERPTRIEYDGVAQCHASNAFERAAALNMLVGNADAAKRYKELAERIRSNFQTRFWVGEHFAEYIHPERGPIANHGLTDVDWSAVALGMALPEQTARIWPLLRDEKRFRYSGMPTGIAAQPETYEAWEFAFNDRMDLAAMGRVWYIEAWARARMGDGEGLAESIRRVADAGKANGYYWRERYNDKGGFGAEKYCEYPANLIRIVQRFLFGVDMRLDGSIAIAPTVPDSYWEQGFGQTLRYRGRQLTYTMKRGTMTGEYKGDGPQRLWVKLDKPIEGDGIRALVGGEVVQQTIEEDVLSFSLPASTPEKVCAFEVRKTGP